MGDPAAPFSRSWLELREPVDHRSRAVELATLLGGAWRREGWTAVLDLGSGTGSNFRYLSPRLTGLQKWALLDHDAELLRHVGRPPPPVSVSCLHGDLETVGLPTVAQTDVVTCSALLDLVTEAWVRQLIDASCRSRCGVYFALSYDGLIRWAGEPDADDDHVRCLVNAHQRRDQGTRTALGPDATGVAERCLRAQGYRTWQVASPWKLTRADAELARALVDGWEQAALELVESRDADRVRRWASRRRHTCDSPAMSLTVGHADLLGLPPSPDF